MFNESIFEFSYNLIYLCVLCCTVLFLIYERRQGFLRRPKTTFNLSRSIVIFFILLLIFLVGLRDFNVGTDTSNYFRTWTYGSNILLEKSDIVFYYIMYLVKSVYESYQLFLFIIASIFYIINYKSLQKISNYFEVNLVFVFFIFLSLFFTLSTSINVMRQGLSLSFLILAISLFPQKKLKKIIFCFMVSLGFHVTSIIAITFLLLIYLFKRISIRWYISLFFLGVILSYLNFSILNISPILEDILSGLGDTRVSYLDPQDSGYQIGFRPDFVLFNTIFLVIFLNIRKSINYNSYYDYLIKFYCLSSFLFFMAFQLNFSDRFGLFSWFVITPLLAPVFRRNYDIKRVLVLLVLLISLYVYFNIIL